jgi:hypothetical protein
MATYSKEFLSESTNGRGIILETTGTPGTLIHTADATAGDEIHLWAWNNDAPTRFITVEFGGVTVPGDTIEHQLQSEDGLELIVPGFVLTGGVEVRAFGGTQPWITVFGFVNRIT